MEQQSIEGYLKGHESEAKVVRGIRPGKAPFLPHIRGGLKEGDPAPLQRKVQKDAERIRGGYFFREDRPDWGIFLSGLLFTVPCTLLHGIRANKVMESAISGFNKAMESGIWLLAISDFM